MYRFILCIGTSHFLAIDIYILGCEHANIPQIAKFMGPTWDPPGSCRPQLGPMLAPLTLLSGTVIKYNAFKFWGSFDVEPLLGFSSCVIFQVHLRECWTTTSIPGLSGSLTWKRNETSTSWKTVRYFVNGSNAWHSILWLWQQRLMLKLIWKCMICTLQEKLWRTLSWRNRTPSTRHSHITQFCATETKCSPFCSACTTFSNAFPAMGKCQFQLKFHWSLFITCLYYWPFVRATTVQRTPCDPSCHCFDVTCVWSSIHVLKWSSRYSFFTVIYHTVAYGASLHWTAMELGKGKRPQ